MREADRLGLCAATLVDRCFTTKYKKMEHIETRTRRKAERDPDSKHIRGLENVDTGDGALARNFASA